MSSVIVAVRVRPFNQREFQKGCKTCLAVDDNTVVVEDSDGETKKFAFDHCYWSFDTQSPSFASQDTVFGNLGSFVQHAFDGFNTSVFAYGQTGSGKSYSMLGPLSDPGIIFRGLQNIFRRGEEYAQRDPQYSLEVEVSFLEIYNESVWDLLIDKKTKQRLKKRGKKSKKKGLRVRVGPQGPFVEGLSRRAIGTFDDARVLLLQGLQSRTVAATKMNSVSSRSHVVFTIYLTQTIGGESAEELESKIHLIDLAGSERLDKSGATGKRAKEAKAINLSLSSLGRVINALSKKQKMVPYRSSVLTLLLRDSLGGNSKTIMLCALSPADDNVDETISTLRYASRAKKIRNKTKKNAGFNRTLRAQQLEEQVTALRARLEKRTESAQPNKLVELEEEIAAREEDLKRLSMTHDEKVAASKMFAQEQADGLKELGVVSIVEAASDTSNPRIVNVSKDPNMSGTMIFIVTKESMTVGSDKSCDIVLQSKGGKLEPTHAVLSSSEPLPGAMDDGELSTHRVMIEKADATNSSLHLYVNGQPVGEERVPLRDGDRIVFGKNNGFVFFQNGQNEDVSWSYEDLKAELQQHSVPLDKIRAKLQQDQEEDAQRSARLAQLRKELDDQKQDEKLKQILGLPRSTIPQREGCIKKLQAYICELESEGDSTDIIKLVKGQLKVERQLLHGERHTNNFEDVLKSTMARVGDLNDWSDEMHKGVVYTVETISFYHDEADRIFDAVFIRETYKTEAATLERLVPKRKFDGEFEDMATYYQTFIQSGAEIANEEFPNDPYVPDSAIVYVGTAVLKVSAEEFDTIGVADDADFFNQIPIVDKNGQECGHLDLDIDFFKAKDGGRVPANTPDEEVDEVELEIQFVGAGVTTATSRVSVSFVLESAAYVQFDSPMSSDPKTEHELGNFHKAYVESSNSNWKKFLMQGVEFHVWAYAFNDPSAIPPTMYQKLMNVQDKMTQIQLQVEELQDELDEEEKENASLEANMEALEANRDSVVLEVRELKKENEKITIQRDMAEGILEQIENSCCWCNGSRCCRCACCKEPGPCCKCGRACVIL